MTPNPRLGDLGLEIDMHANVPYHALKALAAIAPTDDIRFYINGVYIEATKHDTTMVVTNGHYLVAHRHALTKGDPEQAEFKCILPVKWLRSIKVAQRELKFRSDCQLSLEPIPNQADSKEESHAMRATLNLPSGVSMISDTIDGVFPDWRKIMPGTFSKETAQFNPAYVADVYRAIAGCYNKDACIAPLRHNGDKAGAVVYCDTVGVLMPLRIEGDDLPVPDWALSANWAQKFAEDMEKLAA